MQRRADARVEREIEREREDMHDAVDDELTQLRARVGELEELRRKDASLIAGLRAANDEKALQLEAADRQAARYDGVALRRAEAQRAEARSEVARLANALEDMSRKRDELETTLRDERAAAARAKERCDSVRIFRADGAYGSWPDDVRMLLMKLLVCGVSPPEVAEVVASVVDAVVPWAIDAGLSLPNEAFVRRLRDELGVLARSESAVAIGDADRVACAGTDATPVEQLEHAAFNGRLVTGGNRRDLIFGGAYQVADTTAAGEAASVSKMFARLQEDLEVVRAITTRVHGAEVALELLPAAGSVGLHKCGGGGVIITDNASAATAGCRAIQRDVATDVEAHLGAEQCSAMGAAVLAHAKLTYGVNCFRHLPNTWLAGGERHESAFLKGAIDGSIAQLNMSDEEKRKARISPGCAGLVRAIAKEFGTGAGVYAKGEGHKAFRPWLLRKHPKALVIGIQRAEKGSRFDIATRAAWAIYWNRSVLVEFLSTIVFAKDANILKDYLLMMLGCLENIACLRARAIVNDKFTEPMLFLAASNELDEWSVLDMAPVTDMVVAALRTGAADGKTWMVEVHARVSITFMHSNSNKTLTPTNALR